MPPALETANDTDPEVKKATVCAAAKIDAESEDPMDKIVNHYSNKHSMLRGLAWILRVRRHLLKKSKRGTYRLEAADIDNAETFVIK